MSGAPSLLYRSGFVLGTALLFGGMGLGVARSLALERRLPRVALGEQVVSHVAEIERAIEARDYDAAIRQLELAGKLLYTERHRIEELLGRTYLAKHDADEAVVHLRRALALDPGVAEAHHELGLALAEQGHIDAAIAEVREALRLDPGSAAARHNLTVLERRLASQDASPEPAATGPHAAEIEQGRAYAHQFYRGELEALRARFTPGLARKVSPDQLAEMARTVSRQLGIERELLHERVVPDERGATYLRRARFERYSGEVEVVIELVEGQAINAIEFRPATPN